MRVREEKYRPRYYSNRKPMPRRWQLLVILWLALAVPEALLHIATAQGVTTLFSSGLFLSVLFALAPALVVWGLTMLFDAPRLNRFVACAYSFIVFFLCASQLIYYRVFGTFYSAYSMANGGQVLQFWDIVVKKIFQNILLLAGMAAVFIYLCIRGRRFSFRKIKARKMALFPIAVAVAVHFLLVLCLPCFGGTKDMSAYDLYHNNTDSYFSINRLGFLTAFRLDVTRIVTGKDTSGSITLSETGEDTESEEPVEEDTTGTTGDTQTTAPTKPSVDISPNVLDIDFETLIAEEKDSDLKEVHQFFAGRTPSRKNEHTGIFKGSNLILITAEAFSHWVVSKERTPTLYKMMTEGYSFTNYYVPDWGTSTTDGEYAFLTGTVPKSNTWSFSDSSKNSMPLTMCQQLMKQGYSAYAYHGHTYSYYDRNKYLENLGYTYRAYKQGLDVEYVWPESDVEVVDLSTDDFVHNEPFTAYYMTISGHREFSFIGNTMAHRNRDLVENEPYSDTVRAYIACQLELEKSLQLLMQRLEEAGVLENTVIVLTADHYPNGLTVEEYSELAGHDIETNFEIYKNSCIIYKPGMTPETINKPCSHLDLLPTLSNLFGLEFDSRLYMGRDIFSAAEPFVMFRNRSWITDKASYNSNTDEVISFTGEPMEENYIKRMDTALRNRFAVSTRVLDYDYWSILFDE